MKIPLILLTAICLTIVNFSHAQTYRSAEITVPMGMAFPQEQQTLQINMSGIDNSAVSIKNYTNKIVELPGVLYFNMVIDNNQTGHCDLKFSASSKSEFNKMMKDIFCALELKSIKINSSNFDDCEEIIIP